MSKWEDVDAGSIQTRRLRIPGGWLYNVENKGVVFVPAVLDDDEFRALEVACGVVGYFPSPDTSPDRIREILNKIG